MPELSYRKTQLRVPQTQFRIANVHPSLVRLPRRWIALVQDARRVLATAWLAAVCLMAVAGFAPGAQAQGVELPSIVAKRQDGGVVLDFAANLTLSRAVEEGLRHGVPVYFVAEASVKKPRWYWRDDRIARVSRSWRLSYQPLTSAWRVSLGGFSQSFPSLEEALTTITRIAHWRIADSGVDATDRYYVDFQFYLDSSQLPPAMRLDISAQSEWKLGVERTIPVE